MRRLTFTESMGLALAAIPWIGAIAIGLAIMLVDLVVSPLVELLRIMAGG